MTAPIPFTWPPVTVRVAASAAPSAPNFANNYWNLPTVPDLWDDEFTSGSPDLATRGWTVTDAATGAVMSYDGPVLPYTAYSGTGYLASLTPSGLLVRPANVTRGMAIYKAVPGVAFALYTEAYPSRGTVLGGAGADTIICSEPIQFTNTARMVGGNWRSQQRTNFWMDTGQTFSGFAPLLNEDPNVGWGGTILDYTPTADVVPPIAAAGTCYSSFVAPVAQRVSAFQAFTHPNAFTPAFAGIILQNPAPSDRLQYWTLRRMRKLAHLSYPGLY